MVSYIQHTIRYRFNGKIRNLKTDWNLSLGLHEIEIFSSLFILNNFPPSIVNSFEQLSNVKIVVILDFRKYEMTYNQNKT